jgi:hypothetical protein
MQRQSALSHYFALCRRDDPRPVVTVTQPVWPAVWGKHRLIQSAGGIMANGQSAACYKAPRHKNTLAKTAAGVESASMQIDLKVAVLSLACVGVTATAVKADCLSEFEGMMAAHLKAGPYHVSSVGGVKTYNLEVIAPSDFHMTEYEGKNLNTPTGELIFTSKGGWSKRGNAQWEAIPNAAVEQVVAGFIGGLAGGFKNANVSSCKNYESPQDLPNGRKATAYYDFKAEHFDMRFGKVPAEIGLMKGEDGRPAALLVRTKSADETQVITYDAKIKVEPPMP